MIRLHYVKKMSIHKASPMSPAKPILSFRVTEYAVSPRTPSKTQSLDFLQQSSQTKQQLPVTTISLASVPLGSMFNNEIFSDVIFCFKKSKSKLYAHRMALAAQSTVFSAMFQSGIIDTSQKGNEIDIDYDQREEDVFHILLYYMYTGKVKCNSEQLISLLQTAH